MAVNVIAEIELVNFLNRAWLTPVHCIFFFVTSGSLKVDHLHQLIFYFEIHHWNVVFLSAALDLANHSDNLNIKRRHSITLCEAAVLESDSVMYGTPSLPFNSKLSRKRDSTLPSSVSSLLQRRRMMKNAYECMSQDELKHVRFFF